MFRWVKSSKQGELSRHHCAQGCCDKAVVSRAQGAAIKQPATAFISISSHKLQPRLMSFRGLSVRLCTGGAVLLSEMFGFKTVKMSPGYLKGDTLCHERHPSPRKDFFQVTGQLGSKHM